MAPVAQKSKSPFNIIVIIRSISSSGDNIISIIINIINRCAFSTFSDFTSMFAEADKNNDGYIDFVEFMLIFHIMSDGTPEEVLEKIFRVFDVNSDGTINKKEMQRLIKDMYGLIKADDPEAESKDLMAKSVFAEMDKDADGKITCSEFTTACLSQEKISKMLALKVIDIFVEED